MVHENNRHFFIFQFGILMLDLYDIGEVKQLNKGKDDSDYKEVAFRLVL